jgi:hypothetical protein
LPHGQNGTQPFPRLSTRGLSGSRSSAATGASKIRACSCFVKHQINQLNFAAIFSVPMQNETFVEAACRRFGEIGNRVNF